MALPKLNKFLTGNLTAQNILELTKNQEKIISRIKGGSSFYITGEKEEEFNLGLTVGVLQYLNYPMPDTPRCMIIVPNHESAEIVFERFQKFAANMQLGIQLVTDKGKIDDQNMAIYAGADLIIGTIGQILKLYFQCGININKLGLFIILNADEQIALRNLQDITRLTDSFTKFQTIVQEKSIGEKLKKFSTNYILNADTIHFG